MMGEAPSADRHSGQSDGRSFDPTGSPRVGAAATEVAGAARALCLDVVDLVAARTRQSAEEMAGRALALIVFLLGWIASMVALAVWLTRWWPLEGAVLAVAGIHFVVGVALSVGATAADRRARSAVDAAVGRAR